MTWQFLNLDANIGYKGTCHKYSHEVAEVIPPVCAACIKPAQPKIILYKRVNFCKSDLYWTVWVIYLVEAVTH